MARRFGFTNFRRRNARRGPASAHYRGLNYWQSKDGSDRRILVQVDGFLQAIDAKTGKLVETFGDKGKVDLKTGMTRPSAPVHHGLQEAPGRCFENLLILGSATGEAYGSPPADIRAFDVVTGTLAWVFHTIPHPGEYGYDTWPKDAWTYTGGAANWGEMSIDTKRGIAYIPTGTPKYEFWGGDRHGHTLICRLRPGAGCAPGKLLWYYQTVHHDVWEYELVPAPQLVTVHVNGKAVDVVAQASKSGYLYVLDRVTGKPMWPIEERPVPQSDVPGEQLSPTQPFPTEPPPFERMTYTVKDVGANIFSPEERARWIDIISKARNEGIFTPFSTKYFTIQMPGHSGGANLFATASDPQAGTVYVVSYTAPALERLYTTAAEASKYIGGSHYGPSIAEGDPVDGQMIHRARAGGGGGGGGRAGRAGRGNAAAQQGRAMYQQVCQQCHGANLSGETGAAPSLVGVVNRVGEAGVRGTIHDGRGMMPAFDTMADSDLNALLTFPAQSRRGHVGGGGRADARGAAAVSGGQRRSHAHVHRLWRHRDCGDTSLFAHHRLRSEYRHDQVAGSGRRGGGRGSARQQFRHYQRPWAEGASGRNGRRPDVSGHDRTQDPRLR